VARVGIDRSQNPTSTRAEEALGLAGEGGQGWKAFGFGR
jgi:hypothetical protein